MSTERKRKADFEAAGVEQGQPAEPLQQGREEFQAIAEGIVDGLLIAELETKRFLRANVAMQRLTGYSEEELLSMSVREMHTPDNLPHVLENFTAQAEGRLHVLEDCPVLRKDGSIFHANIAANRITYQGRPCLIGFFRDITDRKEMEKTLRQNVDQLEVVCDGMVEGLLITEVATKRFVRVNSPMCRMLGYTEDELLTMTIADIHPPEEVPNDERRFLAAAEGRVSINEERPVLRKGGGILYADITGHPIVFDGKQCLLALFRDVTERKQAEEAVDRERRTLRYMLRASDHERQTIAYDIHDGLAQLLTAAIMQFQTYDHSRDRESPTAKNTFDAGVQMLRRAHAEARRLISGVRPPILDESGITPALAHLVHDQRQADGPEIEFVGRVAFDRLPAMLEDALYRIAQEALSNACKHSGSAKVRVSLVQEEDRVRLEVEDWGRGFDPNAVIGDRFGIEGIRERVRLLEGECMIRSEPGQGTSLAVELPLAGIGE